MWVFAWAVACGETRSPLVMLEPDTAELISGRHRPGNLPGHDQATKEITMHQRQPPADNERPHRLPAPGMPAPASPAPSLPNLVHRRQLEKSVSWSSRERLRCLWHRFRLTIAEMNYATGGWSSCKRPG
jgi:hypothetical protein